MNVLPDGWSVRPLKGLVEILDGRRIPVNRKERAGRVGGVPYYGATGQVGWIDRALFDEPLILLGEDGVQFFDTDKPKAYAIRGPAWVNNHAHVLRPHDGLIDGRYLLHFLNQFDYRGYANGTTRLKLTQAAMNRMPIVLAPLPEQRRIVEILEDHLSHLDAAEAQLALADRKCEPLITAVLQALVPVDPTVVPLTAVADAGELKLGRQRHPDWHMGPNMKPYLRVANVFEDRIDLSDVKSMDFTGVFNNFKLRTGDVLLNEGQSPEYLGRPAIYRGEPSEVAFTNTLIRFRAHADVLPEWALLVFRRHMRSGRFIRESRITTNIAHLSLKRLATVEFPLPSLGEQARLVQRADELLGGVLRMHEEVAARRTQAASLRRSLLSAAFSGRLTGASADQATIEALASA